MKAWDLSPADFLQFLALQSVLVLFLYNVVCYCCTEIFITNPLSVSQRWCWEACLMMTYAYLVLHINSSFGSKVDWNPWNCAWESHCYWNGSAAMPVVRTPCSRSWHQLWMKELTTNCLISKLTEWIFLSLGWARQNLRVARPGTGASVFLMPPRGQSVKLWPCLVQEAAGRMRAGMRKWFR